MADPLDALRKKVSGKLAAKAKATATGSGANQASPQRTIERSGSADGPMARGGNDETAYAKASGSGK